jgi:two-component system sensor histidine kinase KdpD
MVRPLYDGGSVILGFTKVCRDITEQKQADDERTDLLQREREARAQAERANKLKEIFVGMISHELRTPLTSIIGFATTLTAEDVTWSLEEVNEFIAIIHSEAQRMNELIEQLLDVSQQQSGTLRVRPEKRRFQDILGIVMPQLVILTKEHPLALRVPDTLPPLLADPHRVAQVLVNLIGNAAKYSPAHSHITLSAHKTNGFVQFDVADQGVGIPADQHERIFDAFHQAASGSTASRKGIGLGLTICRGIVEAHGGRIWLQSEPGHGTTFSFTIPVAPAE